MGPGQSEADVGHRVGQRVIANPRFTVQDPVSR
jgi:hypothetical protein